MIVAIRNRQRDQRVDTALLRRITLSLLQEELGIADVELGVELVGARAMARVNEDFLGHEGSTDVITFDHAETPARPGRLPARLHGELFICIAEATDYAAIFRTSWQHELVRYVVHGVLHLCGHDDLKPGVRRIMKREEGRLVRALERRFTVARLRRAAPRRATARTKR